MCTWFIYRKTGYQPLPIARNTKNARKAYYKLRHDIRNLRRMHPGHMDVSWYAASLGIEPIPHAAVLRIDYQRSSGVYAPPANAHLP